MKLQAILLTLLPLLARGEVIINEFMSSNSSTLVPNAVAGEFDDWIELKNTGADAIDLGGWSLTDDSSELTLWTFPAGTTIASGDFLVVFASGNNRPDARGNLHTNFKLSKDAEFVGLSRPDGTLASGYHPDGSDYPPQSEDVSYGRHPVTSAAVFFSIPTPTAENSINGVPRVEALEVSPKRGYYQTAQNITLSTETAGATIYYTTDGTRPIDSSGNPTANAQTYSSPVPLSATTVVRAAATAPGHEATLVESHSYLLFDIDGAATNGSDPAGLNTPFLEQVQPPGWANLSSGDYNMDTSVSRSTASSTGHGGLSVSQAMLQGLRDIPTISISLPKEDFAGPSGIYTNSQQSGIAWERACSAEFIPSKTDTRSDFQQDCGLRVQGGASRIPSRSPKHSLSFRFREEYGAGRLKEELFPGSEVENFNSIALRAGYNNSWIHSSASQRVVGSMIRDQWMRESIRDMGHKDAGDGFLVHVFINGLYFGVHNLAERQDNVHYAEYNGGDSDLIDALNGTTVVEGNTVALNAMKNVVGTRNWDDIQEVLDVDTYIDFQIIQRFGANQDLKTNGNWRAAGGGPFDTPTDMRPWKLFSWDGERVLENPGATNVPLDPFGIRNTLESMPEYRQRFSDRAHMHLTGDGALTPANSHARWVKYAETIDRAIIAESARWGDHRRNPEYTRNVEWLSEQSRLANSYFPVRTNNVTNTLIAANLFPDVELPEFKIDGMVSEGGYLPPGSTLTLTGPTGLIYYTLDGSDPANPDGSINPGAIEIASGVSEFNAFPFESPGWTFLDGTTAQSDSNIVVGHPSYDASDWKHESFDDSSWNNGTALFAGDTVTDISGKVANTLIDIGPANARYPTVYFRKSFELSDVSEIVSGRVTVIRDDGFVLYLNGKEIFRENMPDGTITYATVASGNADERVFPTKTFTLASGDLREGTNVLSVEVHNASLASGDLGLDVSLDLDRLVGAADIELPESSTLTARSYVADGGDFVWSAPVTGSFFIEPEADSSNLAIAEINYHPRESTLKEKIAAAPVITTNRDDFEFIELVNTSDSPLNLGGTTFTDGVDLTLDFRVLDPGERVLVVRNEEVFLTRHGDELAPLIAGVYDGGLNNDGETLTISTSSGAMIESLTFNDGGSWPSRADGEGSSLERLDLLATPDDSGNWTSSVAYYGSPGYQGPLEDQRIVINEVSSNSANDYIEIHNTTGAPIDISGWLLTDSKEVYRSYLFPVSTIPANGYLVIEESDYDPTPSNVILTFEGTSGASPTRVTSGAHGLSTGDLVTIDGYGGISDYNQTFEIAKIDDNRFSIPTNFLDNDPTKGNWIRNRPFGLSAGNGDDLWLLETDLDGNPVAFVDHVEFAAAAADTTLGRWFDGDGNGTLYTMISETKGAANSGPLLGPVYLTEVHYNPTTSDDHEFVEVTNTGSTTLSLDNWRLRGGVDFDFGPTHVVEAGSSLVIVSFDPIVETGKATDFRNTFGIDAGVALIGPSSDGPLGNDGGTVRLQKAGPPEDYDQITADEVRYLSNPPWPATGGGHSINRLPSLAFGLFANSWTAAEPTPGSFDSGESYESWAAENGVGDPLDDPDRDQLSNFLEFAMGTDPNTPDDYPLLTVTDDMGSLRYPQSLVAQGVVLSLETSLDLENWNPEPTSVVETTDETQTREYQFEQSLLPKLHWRLRAVGNP